MVFRNHMPPALRRLSMSRLGSVSLSGCVYLCAAQCPADGVLFTFPAGCRSKAQRHSSASCRCRSFDMGVTLEPDPQNRRGHHALRLGLRLVKGLPRGEGERIAASRQQQEGRPAFESLADIMRRADVSANALQVIAAADGFSSMRMGRRQAQWQVQALARQRLHEMPLFAQAGRRHDSVAGIEPAVSLPSASGGEEVAADYRSLGMSLKAHPITMLAPSLQAAGWQSCAVAHDVRDETRLRLAGLVTMRQRPGTASGTVFLTVEDDVHALNVIIRPKLTETYREALLRSQILGVVGCVQREQSVVHFIAESLFNLNGFLRHLDSVAAASTSGTRMRSRDFR